VRQLERRARTTAEVRKHLRGRGFGAAEVGEVLGRLSRLGYLDDRAYAVRYVSWAAEEKPMGRRRVTQELMRRGVDRGTIDAALDEVFGDEQEAAALGRALKRAARGVSGQLDERARRRVASYLLRRGFRPGQVMAAVRALAAASGAHGAADEATEESEE
jgi:regulatory protein